jgi:hypothetical protein
MSARELAVVAEARWPDAGGLPDAGDPTENRTVPPVPGFVLSSFNPLVAELAERCLRRSYGAPPVPPDFGQSLAMIVVSASGDTASARHVARAVDSGSRVGPLMFFQSVPNSIAGHVAARWGLGGPVVCLCPVGDPMAEGLAQAALLIQDGDATAALVVLVEQSGVDGQRATAAAVFVDAVSPIEG